ITGDSNMSNGLGVFTISNLQQNIKFSPDPTTSSFNTPTASPYPNPTATGQPPAEYTIGQIFDLADAFIKNAFNTMLRTVGLVEQNAMAILKQYNTSLVSTLPDYKKLMAAVAKQASILPPGPALAGVMTLVDENQGVWTAPANLNIGSVIAPTVSIDNDQQATLNVDALAGKSINAIRSFVGRGPIIWGARTLDGNSLDWRYVNVRRTMIMIEQSIKNACFELVYQTNDTSTWTLVESMIGNFLDNLWSAGCLLGATPEDAYSVSCGIGKTMTPSDLLAGMMRVQVKLALVHPAEFMIITYEQEMASS
ncbi:MAG: phage tail sheath C-terminal domain-containing protein, partial [Bacteroidota bacterium]